MSGKPSRSKILKIIALTSVIWLILDIALFYSTGFIAREQSLRSQMKMPTEHKIDRPVVVEIKELDRKIQIESAENFNEEKNSLIDIYIDDVELDVKEKLRENEKHELLVDKGSDEKVELNVALEEELEEDNDEDDSLNDEVVDKEESKVIFEKVHNTDTSVSDPMGPGERGRPVRTEAWEEASVKKGWQQAQFNQYVSDKISLQRSIPDTRSPRCAEQEYPYNLLPKTTILICFTEESWSTLLRTIHSVINRSPPDLVQEILLIDDFSQREHLQKPLQEYLKKFPKVRLIRTEKREGLIRARMIGIAQAKAPVVTFLDSHVECNLGWLEPLLNTIRLNRKTVVAPLIDQINEVHFGYSSAMDSERGGFRWSALAYTWIPVPPSERRKRNSPVDNIRSPTIAGGLFSIDKSFFYELGLYDPGLEIWGAENMELSFKTWMCGGQLELVPCSRVGHIFRSKQPYKFPSGDNLGTFLRNSQRVAEVWLDDYKEIFYLLHPHLRYQPITGIEDRVRLRSKLNCKSFKWYLESVYPEQQLPNAHAKARGQIKNVITGLCFDAGANGGKFGLLRCHGAGGNQEFRLTEEYSIEFRDKCIQRSHRNHTALELGKCFRTSKVIWKHRAGQNLEDKETGLCLTAVPSGILQTNVCDNKSPAQKWQFGKYF